jgi:hypothetical protein
VFVGDVPGHPDDVFRLAARLLQHRHDVLQGLPDLIGKVVAVEYAVLVPADHAGDKYHAATGGDAVGITFGARPAGR